MKLFMLVQWLVNVWNVLFSKRKKVKIDNQPTTGTLFKPKSNIWQQGLPSKEKRIKNRNKRKGKK